MSRFAKTKEQEALETKRAEEAEKSRIWLEVSITVPPELQWSEYFQQVSKL